MEDPHTTNPLEPTVGWRVWRCCVDYQFRLLLFGERDEPSAELIIGTDFRYVTPEGTVHTLAPSESPRALAPALSLLRQECIGASVDEDGRLRLAFSDGSRLEVDPDPDYEAWEISEFGLICLPGGGLSWTPPP